jgi:hypothetical protein
MNGVAEIGYRVEAVEYESPDGTMLAWWTEMDMNGFPMVAVATRADHQSYPWTVVLMRPGWRTSSPVYPSRYIGQYRNLVRARMDVLGGNGHRYRGHTSVAEVREMSRANILALARG